MGFFDTLSSGGDTQQVVSSVSTGRRSLHFEMSGWAVVSSGLFNQFCVLPQVFSTN